MIDPKDLIFNRIQLALQKPLLLLCASGDPRSERMMYMNYIRKNNLKGMLTVLYKQEFNRIIIGPKNFNLVMYVASYNTCSQADIDFAWSQASSDIPVAQKSQMEIEAEKPRVSQDDILTSLGFGGKKI